MTKRICVIGGGLGVAYVESEEAPTITQWGNVLRDAVESLGVRAHVSVEPGRSIVASAADISAGTGASWSLKWSGMVSVA